MRGPALPIFALVFASVAAAAPAQDAKYVFTFIDVPGACSTSANAINNKGQIVGSYTLAPGGPPHGFLRQPDASYVSFDVPGNLTTSAREIDDAGHFVGASLPDLGNDDEIGFVRSVGGGFATINPPGSTRTEVTRRWPTALTTALTSWASTILAWTANNAATDYCSTAEAGL